MTASVHKINGDAFANLVNTGSVFSSYGLPFVYMVHAKLSYMVHAETKFVLSSVKRTRSTQVNLIIEVMASEITAQQPRRKKKGCRRIFRAMFFRKYSIHSLEVLRVSFLHGT